MKTPYSVVALQVAAQAIALVDQSQGNVQKIDYQLWKALVERVSEAKTARQNRSLVGRLAGAVGGWLIRRGK